MITLVKSCFTDWNTTLWRDINVENMEMDCKKFVKDIRGLDKEMRAWDAFTGLDSTVKNMVTSLRAVGELQNPAIRDRHWEQLMQATQVCRGGADCTASNHSGCGFLYYSLQSHVHCSYICPLGVQWSPSNGDILGM